MTRIKELFKKLRHISKTDMLSSMQDELNKDAARLSEKIQLSADQLLLRDVGMLVSEDGVFKQLDIANKIMSEEKHDMNSADRQYTDLLDNICNKGTWEKNRTGIDTKTIVGAMFQHNMQDGFPLLMIKRHPFKTIKVELEGFIKGIISKEWYQERGCTIWDEWCNPEKVAYGIDKTTQDKMRQEDDLGRIYGAQWREFRGSETSIDQLAEVVRILKKDPTSRRAICSAWNPTELNKMALPPCHVMWQAMIVDGKLCLTWYQRSVDTPLGLPFNIASYALLLHLLAKELKVEEGTLTGFLNNVHFYRNQLPAVETIQRRRNQIDVEGNYLCDNGEIIGIHRLPRIETLNFTSIVNWSYNDTNITADSYYKALPKIEIPIAI